MNKKTEIVLALILGALMIGAATAGKIEMISDDAAQMLVFGFMLAGAMMATSQGRCARKSHGKLAD